ncbi:nitrogenase molybdenum-iron protein subunit beta [Gorillibacterium sp. sgz500922]|uniref:nitrogenase molybdenum-iron protein subunit beta n=1 Tax=Gorillibacterium sp. sgz500922 TaxID=3446694 RepID=UPI003F6773A6
MSDAFVTRDHNTLFSSGEYTEQAERKRRFENPCSFQEVESTLAYTKTKEYAEKNFAREALVINPAKACQPLGAVLASLGFAKTLPFVQGSQGCVAYFLSHLARHFKEPVPAVSSSMTEDAAVFGGMSNLIEGLRNATALYKPDMIAMSTTCMAEVIGDDLGSFIGNARSQGAIPEDFPVAYANTPSFVGSHITGYDAMMRSLLTHLSERGGADPAEAPKRPSAVNVVMGFDTYTGNFAEVKRLFSLLGAELTVLGDYSDNLDSPADGEYHYYYGGTTPEEVAAAPGAAGTILLQKYATKKTSAMIGEKWKQETVSLYSPIGVRATDRLLSEASRLTGIPIPEALVQERGRVVDAYTDSHPYLHGRRVAMAGDPDFLLGLLSFCLEVGLEPVHIVCTNGDKDFEEEANELLNSSPYGIDGKVYIGKDLWHMRSLLITDPVDFVYGSTHMKYAAKDSATPLIRVGFPIFDRHHLHRFPIIGYQGALHLLAQTVNAVLEKLDEESPGYNFDLVR